MTQNKTSWGGTNKTNTPSWSGTYGKSQQTDTNSEFSTLTLDGSNAEGFGGSIGAWGRQIEETATKKSQYGASFTAQKEKGTAWGALKREKEKKVEGRGGQGRATTAPKTPLGTGGFGSSAKTGFGTGFSSFSAGAKTGFGTGGYGGTTAGTSAYGKSTTTGTSKFGFGRTSGASALNKLRESGEYITSRGQPFISYPVILANKSHEEKEYQCRHICSVPRFYDYPVEMLRYYDYVFGGGIDWVDPNPTEVKGTDQKQMGIGLQAATVYEQISPWTLTIQELKNTDESAPDPTQPYGVLPATLLQPEPTHQDLADEDYIPVRQRGFLVSRTLFDNMKDYAGPSKTPGFKKVEPNHSKGFYF